VKTVPQPSRDDLIRVYDRLQMKASKVSVDELVLWARWSRLDARLAEILVHYISKRFDSLNPVDLWEANSHLGMPQALAVLAEFAESSIREDRVAAFRVWKRALTDALEPAPFQAFFVPQAPPTPRKIRLEIGTNLRAFAKWGFFSSEWIARVKSAESSRETILSKPARRDILDRLMLTRSQLTVDDFIEACSHRVHRRTAERDLSEANGLVPVGSTRARTYRVRARTQLEKK